MGKKDKNKDNLPPSLFDNLDLFAAASAAQDEAEKPERKSAKSAKAAPPPPTPASKGLAGAGPMQQLYDFNFRQYSAYVICSRAIPAVEDGLKPVQRRIMYALYEQDDVRYTEVAK